MSQTFELTFSGLPSGGATIDSIPLGLSVGTTVSVNWGDGTTDALLSHTYTSTGPYNVTITTSVGGTFTHFGVATLTWGQQYLTGVGANLPPTITSLSYAFSDASGFNQNINTWNTTAVTDMSFMFSNATNFNNNNSTLNLITDNVTNMSNMFANAALFNQDISAWNIGSVTNMQEMFSSALAFNNGDTGNLGTKPLTWTTPLVNNMNGMFGSALVFNQDISTFSTNAVTNMKRMFYGATRFNNGNITNAGTKPLIWTTSNVTNMNNMFYGTLAFNQQISTWDTSHVTDTTSMFQNAALFNNGVTTNAGGAPLSWITNSIQNAGNMFSGAAAFNQDVSTWNTSNMTVMNYMFQNATLFNNGDITDAGTKPLTLWTFGSGLINLGYMFNGAAAFNQDISTWDTVNITNTLYMFLGATLFNQNISTWTVTSLANASNMLDGTALSTTNYDALLNGWAAQTLKPGVNFGAAGIKYSSAGASAHLTITSAPNSWNVTDGGLAPPCFAAGTRICTPTGYIAVEQLKTGDHILTADGRSVPIKHYVFHISHATITTAPYRIKMGALGPNLPTRDITVSGNHTIKDAKGIWQNTARLAKTNSFITQYGIGTDIIYYHIECPNYYTDDLVSEGIVVESYTNIKGPLYTYNRDIGGFVRINPVCV